MKINGDNQMNVAAPDPWRHVLVRARCEEHLKMWLALLESRVPYMQGRGERIDAACGIMANTLDMSNGQRYGLSLAAKFHDIGMLGVPDTLIVKPGQLTPEDQARFDEHTDLGGRLVAKVFPDFHEGIEGIWFHHDRPDGRGPHGLCGDELPVIAAIVSVVDAVEAMANGRPYRKAMKLDDIIAEIRSNTDAQFTRKVVGIFLQLADEIYKAVAARPDGTQTVETSVGLDDHPEDRPDDQSQHDPQARSRDPRASAPTVPASGGDGSVDAGHTGSSGTEDDSVCCQSRVSLTFAGDKSAIDLSPATIQQGPSPWTLVRQALDSRC